MEESSEPIAVPTTSFRLKVGAVEMEFAGAEAALEKIVMPAANKIIQMAETHGSLSREVVPLKIEAPAAQSITAPQSEPKAQPRSPKKTGESSSRAGRIGSFEKIDFGLDESKERTIHEFYTSRRPNDQSEQVAVAMYIGAKLLGRTGFEYNEIYSLLHLGGERELPKALDNVMSSLVGNNWVAKLGKQFSLKFLATDYVENLSPKNG